MLFGAFPSVGLVVAPGDVLLEPDPLDTALPRDPRFAARAGTTLGGARICAWLVASSSATCGSVRKRCAGG
jgi:hypothetical protein